MQQPRKRDESPMSHIPEDGQFYTSHPGLQGGNAAEQFAGQNEHFGGPYLAYQGHVSLHQLDHPQTMGSQLQMHQAELPPPSQRYTDAIPGALSFEEYAPPTHPVPDYAHVVPDPQPQAYPPPLPPDLPPHLRSMKKGL